MDYTTKAKKSKRSAVKNITVIRPSVAEEKLATQPKQKGHRMVSFALASYTDLDIFLNSPKNSNLPKFVFKHYHHIFDFFDNDFKFFIRFSGGII